MVLLDFAEKPPLLNDKFPFFDLLKTFTAHVIFCFVPNEVTVASNSCNPDFAKLIAEEIDIGSSNNVPQPGDAQVSSRHFSSAGCSITRPVDIFCISHRLAGTVDCFR